MPLNPLYTDLLTGLLRHLLGGLATYLVTTGMATEADATRWLSGVALALVTLGWSAYQKTQKQEEVRVALTMPKGTTEAGLRTAMQARG